MKYLSRQAAIESVKKSFSNTSEDAITLQDAYTAWERDLTQEEKNKGWFSNKMVDMKYHNLVKSVYAIKNNRRTLDKIQLTIEGKRAIGRIEGNVEEAESNSHATNGHNNPLSIADVMKIVAKLKKENPEFEIIFDVRLKTG